MKKIDLYTDGACSGNPGPGGWGVVLLYKGVEKQISGYASESTNNRMELTAVIEALRALKKPCQITLYTDSRYVMDGMTKWLAHWKQNNWKTANKKSAVKNVDLWQELDALVQKYDIKWVWVKGHNGHAENERVDELARGECEKYKSA